MKTAEDLPIEKVIEALKEKYQFYSSGDAFLIMRLIEYASQFKTVEAKRPIPDTWISPTGALMSDRDYQFLSDSQKAKMKKVKTVETEKKCRCFDKTECLEFGCQKPEKRAELLKEIMDTDQEHGMYETEKKYDWKTLCDSVGNDCGCTDVCKFYDGN